MTRLAPILLALLLLSASPALAKPGDPDRTFGRGGLVSIPFEGGWVYDPSLAVQPGGRIVAGADPTVTVGPDGGVVVASSTSITRTDGSWLGTITLQRLDAQGNRDTVPRSWEGSPQPTAV